MNTKILTRNEVEKLSQELRDAGKKIVTTNGSYDVLHLAHVHLLEKAKNEGDVLIVLVNSDRSVRNFKGADRPIVPEHERAAMLAALTCVDHVVVFDEDTPLSLLAQIKPHMHAKGGSWIAERIQAEQELLAQWGGVFKNFPLEEGYSTTNVIDKIQKLRE